MAFRVTRESNAPPELGATRDQADADTQSARIDASLAGRIAKRCVDVVVAVLALVCASLLFLVIVVAIKVDSPGPVFFSHQRVGRYGKKIRVLKFRTMVPDAGQQLRAHLERRPDLKAAWDDSFKLREDPRVTRVGSVLRRFSLDELPQLLNVLRGEMSLVGPRPVVEEELERFGNRAPVILRALPGLTGLWAVSGRSELPYDERVALEYRYVTTWSLGLDLSILLRTIPVVIRGHGTY
jgi:exopolysaccharide production protein ExoY